MNLFNICRGECMDLKKMNALKSESLIKTIEKLYKRESLSTNEKLYLLTCAYTLLNEYIKSDSVEYFELAYDIIIRYSVNSKDFRPLYDLACNFGFYPIANYITSNELLERICIGDAVIDYKLNEFYKNDNYIETFEQSKTRRYILESEDKRICFVAPTSSGKSSVIVQHIRKNKKYKKAIIIVPSKSLIEQTYKELRKYFKDRKLLCHDSMYQGEENFVAVLTQERTERLLESNESLSIDVIYVDEAHNIFGNDSRSILLSRVLKLCQTRNNSIQILYLSPFISNPSDLQQIGGEKIIEQRIQLNMKEPDYHVLDDSCNEFLHNRFWDHNIYINKDKKYQDCHQYIVENAKKKNLIFLYSPRKIEEFAEEFYSKTNSIELTTELRELIDLLADTVHPDFKVIKYLHHGILYIHARIPTQIKEYLEYQFKTNSSIKYLIANSVVLEGINMPIDSLFVLSTHRMNNKQILNLIGRVNRLNDVFDNKNGNLVKLLPNVHFVNSYYSKRPKMQNVLKKLYSEKAIPEVFNPLLLGYSVDRLVEEGVSPKTVARIVKENEYSLKCEEIYFSKTNTQEDMLKKKLVASGVNNLIEITEGNLNLIQSRIEEFKDSEDYETIDLVKKILVDNIEIRDKSFGRFKHTETVVYYKNLMRSLKTESFKTVISGQLAFFMGRKSSEQPYMYIGSDGDSFGPYDDMLFEDNPRRNKAYLYLKDKSQTEILNALVVKLKLEQDCIGFQYLLAVSFLHDVGLISDEKYN